MMPRPLLLSLLLAAATPLPLIHATGQPPQQAEARQMPAQATGVQQIAMAETNDTPDTRQAQELHRKVYAFEHKLLPNWVHNSSDRFFRVLLDGNESMIREVATEIVGQDFANQLQIKTIVPDKAVLIVFAPPTQSPQCYAAIVAEQDNGYIYYTLEKTNDFEDTGTIKSMYCAWVSAKSRKNFGPRSYTSAEAFVEEFLKDTPSDALIGQDITEGGRIRLNIPTNASGD